MYVYIYIYIYIYQIMNPIAPSPESATAEPHTKILQAKIL